MQNQAVSNSYQNNFLISPLFRYNNAVRATFAELPDNGAKIEVIKRIGIIVIAPFAYLALAFTALIGLALDPLLNRIKEEETKSIIGNQSSSGRVISDKNVVDLSIVNGNPADLSSFVYEIPIEEDKKAKFNALKYLYSKSIHGPNSPVENCSLKFQLLEDANKLWSLIDSNGNTFSVLMNSNGKLSAQVSKYRESLEILISHL